MAGAVERHRRPRPALGVLHAARSASKEPGSLSNYDPDTHTLRVSGFGDHDNALNVKKNFTNFKPRTGVSWRLNDS